VARDLGIIVGAFVLATGVAAVLGAANLGTALSFGQIGFAIALVWVLLRE
jgi:type IV secretory pathway VirB2 component (pilin)